MKNLSIRNNNGHDPYFLDEFFGDQFAPLFKPFFQEAKNDRLMKTDIKETDSDFILDVEVPGFKKENIAIDLDNGYLTVSAKKEETEEEKKPHFLHRERSLCSQRAFYVGDVKQEDIKAKYDNGVLAISFPKESKKEDTKKGIMIE